MSFDELCYFLVKNEKDKEILDEFLTNILKTPLTDHFYKLNSNNMCYHNNSEYEYVLIVPDKCREKFNSFLYFYILTCIMKKYYENSRLYYS